MSVASRVVAAAIGTAVFALILVLYFERDLAGVPYPGLRFGRQPRRRGKPPE